MSNESNDLHPIIDDLLDEIRKQTDIWYGEKKQVVEEFILPDEGRERIIKKLKQIEDPEEQKEAILSLSAFALMVEKQGWEENAQKLNSLGEEFKDLFFRLNRSILPRRKENIKPHADRFWGTSNNKETNVFYYQNSADPFDPWLED